MLNRFTVVCLLLLSLLNSSFAQRIQLSSPSGVTRLRIENSDHLFYSLSNKGRSVIDPSSVEMVFNRPDVSLNQFVIIKIDSSTKDETWAPVWGEENKIRNHYKELMLTLKDKAESGIMMKIIFRVFDEGLGFRYEFPEQASLKHFIVSDELTQFKVTADHKTFWIPGDYDSNEYPYNTTLLSEIDALTQSAKEPDIAVKSQIGLTAVQTPLMMKSKDGLYLNIHEAA